jgi:alpha-1,3-fucosyltransferase
LDKKSFGQEKCSPTRASGNARSYSVEINGVRYPHQILLHQNRSINFECLNKNSEIKRILLWTTYFNDPSWTFGVSLGVRKPFETLNCPVTNCELLNNKTRINESDYVVAHMSDIWKTEEKIPIFRPKFQRWIFTTYESPIRSNDYSKFNRVFNLTSTYMLDSDFPGNYQVKSNFIWEKNKTFDIGYDFTQGKIGLAVAIISNCRRDEKSNRFDYIKEMRKYMKVDVFGDCGEKCPSRLRNNISVDCKEIVATEYKFFLSFENSICREKFDITEKFFSILKYNIIPVVLGGGSYNKFVSFKK